jgi:putative membrane protein
MMDGYGPGGAGWIVMGLIWVLLLAVIVVALVRIFPGRDDRPAAAPLQVTPPERPLEILDRRLASGEIDLETYDRLRERLAEAARGR